MGKKSHVALLVLIVIAAGRVSAFLEPKKLPSQPSGLGGVWLHVDDDGVRGFLRDGAIVWGKVNSTYRFVEPSRLLGIQVGEQTIQWYRIEWDTRFHLIRRFFPQQADSRGVARCDGWEDMWFSIEGSRLTLYDDEDRLYPIASFKRMRK